MENPWNIQSIYDLQYFNCPSCVYKNHSKQELINHANDFHPESIEYLTHINDKSLIDVILPWNVSEKEIKSEENDLDSINSEETDYYPLYVEVKEIKTDNCKNEQIKSFDSLKRLTGITISRNKNQNKKKCESAREKFDRLYNHVPKNHVEANNKCETCGKLFPDIGGLKKHINNVHEKKRQVTCEKCGKDFTQPYSLKVHMKAVHEGQKEHKCEQCGKVFGYKLTLKDHIRTVHEKIKCHVCETCGKAFGQSSNLKYHIRTVHQGLKDFKCETCGNVFGHAQGLQLHVKTVHEGQKDYKCEICGKNFGKQSNLKRHMRTVHE